MLTTKLRRLPSPRTLGWLSALTALSTALLGCPDALHLNAGAGGGASSGSGPGSGSGGSGAQACISNPDCTYPTAVCDTVKNICVECLVVEDCAGKPGTVCSLGKCTCPDEAPTFCAAVEKQLARCVDTKTTQSDCGSCGYTCFGGCTGGVCNSGWAKVSEGAGVPSARTRHVAVWDTVDKLMIVWGGVATDGKPLATGGIYDPSHNAWTPMSPVDAPEARFDATAVWDAMHHEMIVWGGATPTGRLATGGRFNPQTNTWKALSTDKAPLARSQHTAVWTTDSNGVMIVWGGHDGMGYLDTGAYYDPSTDAWTPLPSGGPSMRGNHSAVWDGNLMLVWGGIGPDGAMPPMNMPLGDGFSFNLMMNQWKALPSSMQPSARSRHTAVWTAKSMLVFGGNTGMSQSQDGAQYQNGGWTKLGVTAAPEPRQDHTAVWMPIPMASKMIVWGGEAAMKGVFNTGYSLDENLLSWKPIPTALSPRARHTAVVADSKMIIWGGDTGAAAGATNSGGIFDANAK